MKTSTIKTDILIIGGGSAGIMAALRAKEINPQQRVVIFEKGNVKYSGCLTKGTDALKVVTVPGTAAPEDYVEDAVLSCEGILDEGPSYEMAKRSWPLMKKLIDWGVGFPKNDGQYEIIKTHAQKGYTVTMKEPNLKGILFKRLQNTDCVILNRTMAVDLIKEDGRVAGAIGMNIRTGELIICNAKAVIISSGGCARFGLPSNGYLYGVYDCPANTGDGYNLAYQAGAELTGLEYTMHLTNDNPECERYAADKGISENNTEFRSTETFLCGGHGLTGIVINEKAESSIPGLYAAGDAANVGKGHLTGAFVFGEIAAETASEYVKTVSNEQAANSRYLKAIEDKIEKWLNTAKPEVTIEEFEYKTRRLIGDFLTSPKNENKLNRGIETMKIMQKELFEIVKIKNTHDLVKAFEAESIISCGILSATASKERKESRWGSFHYRSDYPAKDDEKFLKLLIVKKDEKTNLPAVSLRDPQKVLDLTGNNAGRVTVHE